jgi:hypothetical protein
MASVIEAQRKIETFFKKELKKKGAVKDVTKTSQGWRGLFEALEINALLLEKGHEVIDRIFYRVELNEALTPTSYGVCQGKEGEESEEET